MHFFLPYRLCEDIECPQTGLERRLSLLTSRSAESVPWPSATLTPRTFEEETRRMAERDNSSKNDEIESAKGQLLEDVDNEGTKEATEEEKEKQFDKKKCFSWEASKKQ